MTGIVKDFSFAIAYLDDIIIFSKMAEEHLDHIKQFHMKASHSVFHNERLDFLHNRIDMLSWRQVFT